MYTSGFPTQPSATSIADDELTIQFVSGNSENVRCVVLLTGETAPTATEVNDGTGGGGIPPQAAPALQAVTAEATHNYFVGGLTPDTTYDAYCATANGAVSNVLTFSTSGFAVSPAVNTAGYASGQVTVVLTLHNTENVRCAIFPHGAAAPTAAAINAGSSGALVSPTATSGTGGSALNIAITGLSDATHYQV